MSEPGIGRAVILCGGKGTRLRAAVSDRPKPLAWVAGRPFISYLLEELETAGVRQCVLATGYLGGKFQQVFGDSFGKMALVYSQEETALGTGGALRRASAQLPGEGPIAILNGDSYCSCAWEKLASAHRYAGRLATMVVTPFRGPGRFGGPICDAAGAVVAFAPAHGEDSLINAGIYVVESSICAEIPADRECSLEREIFPVLAASGHLHGFRSEGPLLDIGLPETYHLAQRIFRTAKPPQFFDGQKLRALSPESAAMFAPKDPSESNKWKLAVGVILRNVRGEILLERRADCGLWGLPGGRMDLGESARDTAIREVREETGLEISVERLVGVYTAPVGRIISYEGGDVVQCLTIVVEASLTSGTLTVSPESTAMEFFPPDRLPPDTLPHAQECLLDCLQKVEAVLH